MPIELRKINKSVWEGVANPRPDVPYQFSLGNGLSGWERQARAEKTGQVLPVRLFRLVNFTFQSVRKPSQRSMTREDCQ